MGVRLLGVTVENATMAEALALLEEWCGREDRTRAVYFVNANTLNIATSDPSYRALLNRADVVLGDGVGVRLAARLKGVAMRDNVNGTDFTPALLTRASGRLFLLGAAPESNARAADHCRRAFPRWEVVGARHGYYEPKDEERVVEEIRVARPHLLLVAFGNPLQERFIDRNRERLGARIAMGIGGLFDYWSATNVRAPERMRELSMEWVHILFHQPRKARRYLIGNPLFMYRAVADRIVNGPAV